MDVKKAFPFRPVHFYAEPRKAQELLVSGEGGSGGDLRSVRVRVRVKTCGLRASAVRCAVLRCAGLEAHVGVGVGAALEIRRVRRKRPRCVHHQRAQLARARSCSSDSKLACACMSVPCRTCMTFPPLAWRCGIWGGESLALNARASSCFAPDSRESCDPQPRRTNPSQTMTPSLHSSAYPTKPHAVYPCGSWLGENRSQRGRGGLKLQGRSWRGDDRWPGRTPGRSVRWVQQQHLSQDEQTKDY